MGSQTNKICAFCKGTGIDFVNKCKCRECNYVLHVNIGASGNLFYDRDFWADKIPKDNTIDTEYELIQPLKIESPK